MRTAKEKAARGEAYRLWATNEADRVRRQRAYLTTLKGPIRDSMVRRLLDRAWVLLDAGDAEAADALLEFAPEADAARLLDEFFYDDA